MTAPPLRVALADDQALVRAGLRALLQQQGIVIVFEADDGHARLPLREGHGLTGMRERIDALGGELHIGRGTGGGMRIDAALPA